MREFGLKKFNNRGSALIFVIVIVAFISILSTTVLYISGSNYVNKMTDMDTKEGFYEAETALEQVKAGMMVLASEAAEKAYLVTMSEYSVDDPDTRFSTFEDVYFDELEKLWIARLAALGSGHTYLDVIQAMADGPYASCISFGIDSTTGAPYDGTLDKSDLANGFVFIRGLELEYTDASGFYTKIATDMVFSVPEMNWAFSNSLSIAGTPIPAGVAEDPDIRKTYDIAGYVNYSNWRKE